MGVTPAATPPKRKFKSRKGLDKAYVCDSPNCNKAFTRAEHLDRHKLNHLARPIYFCSELECKKSFVRRDLYLRHLAKRHGAEGSGSDQSSSAPTSPSQEVRTHPVPSQPLPVPPPLLPSAVTSAGATVPSSVPSLVHAGQQAHPHEQLRQTNHQNVQHVQAPPMHHPAVVHPPSLPNLANLPAVQNGQPQTHPTHFIHHPLSQSTYTNPVFSTAPLPPLMAPVSPPPPTNQAFPNCPDPPLTPVSHVKSEPGQPDQDQELDPGADENAVVRLPGSEVTQEGVSPPSTQLINWLFSSKLLSMNPVVFDRSDQNTPFYSLPSSEQVSGLSPIPIFHSDPDISEHKRLELIQLIPALANYPIFTVDNIELFLQQYWSSFHFQFPILHRPTFRVETTAGPLLLSMILIGGSFKGAPQDFLMEVATALRWVLFSAPEFHPPTRAWVIQALLLLECYEKGRSSIRKLHERAHIHHGATIQLIRRGSTLMGQSVEPPTGQLNTNTWTKWIEAESIKRSVYMAFILDVSHSLLFGHSQLMHPHELRTWMPCEDELWNSTNLTSSDLQQSKISTVSYLNGLKNVLNRGPIKCGSILGDLSLLYGIISLSIRMAQQDVEMTFVGWNSFKDRWQSTLGSTYDFWYSNTVPSSNAVNRLLAVNYHFAHVSMNVARYNLRVYCGDPLVFGLETLQQDYYLSVQYMQDWCHQPAARIAAFHALKILYDTFVVHHDQYPYNAGHDPVLHNPLIVAHCALVYWAYAYCLDGPEYLASYDGADEPLGGVEWAVASETAQSFLMRSESLIGPENLDQFYNRNHTVGLMKLVSTALNSCPWFVTMETRQMINLSIRRSLGWVDIIESSFNPSSSTRLVQVG